MGQDAQVALALSGGFASRSQERSEAPLVPREGALDLPALAERASRETNLHFAAIPARRPLARPSRLQRNNRAPDAQGLAAKDVMRLAVVGGVGHHAAPVRQGIAFAHERSKLRRVVRRADSNARGRPEVALTVAQHRQLGPTLAQRFSAFRLFPAIIAADVAGLEAGGVDDPLGLGLDQARKSRALEGAPLEYVKSPFFSSRASAFCKVVKWGTFSRRSVRRNSGKSLRI